MKPKDKAKQLMEGFAQIQRDFNQANYYGQAKRSAILAVDEMIKSTDDKTYWLKVKDELNENTKSNKESWAIDVRDKTIESSPKECYTVSINNEPSIFVKITDPINIGEKRVKTVVVSNELLDSLIRCVDRLEENGFGEMFAVKKAKEVIKRATE